MKPSQAGGVGASRFSIRMCRSVWLDALVTICPNDGRPGPAPLNVSVLVPVSFSPLYEPSLIRITSPLEAAFAAAWRLAHAWPSTYPPGVDRRLQEPPFGSIQRLATGPLSSLAAAALDVPPALRLVTQPEKTSTAATTTKEAAQRLRPALYSDPSCTRLTVAAKLSLSTVLRQG